jgi:hypothetical protein
MHINKYIDTNFKVMTYLSSQRNTNEFLSKYFTTVVLLIMLHGEHYISFLEM